MTVLPPQRVFPTLKGGKMMTNELIQMLTEKEVCGGDLSEKVCYDFAEEQFGFDSANINMV